MDLGAGHLDIVSIIRLGAKKTCIGFSLSYSPSQANEQDFQGADIVTLLYLFSSFSRFVPALICLLNVNDGHTYIQRISLGIFLSCFLEASSLAISEQFDLAYIDLQYDRWHKVLSGLVAEDSCSTNQHFQFTSKIVHLIKKSEKKSKLQIVKIIF